ncbi:GMC family oxidoreductase [Subtercola frigoramans]|uniref:Choline dehydrogenase-like flavoprotein n=1 Tax=Subtercola frigoramans TaxID=120298 RepID=A0ABS2L998_9MICO|nr:GMC oxidoreductase [Subtercola frigoramans]MBM7473673.1 choline dehydrogenase-like flavoprotein [Subtercola frigoramans]
MVDAPASVHIVIVGSGPIGAIVARQLRVSHPGATIAMVEAGPKIGTRADEHLSTTADPAVRRFYAKAVRSAVQSEYVSASPATCRSASGSAWDPGVHPLSVLGEAPGTMIGAGFSWNVGGMGAHWTAACPSPFGREIPAFLDPSVWDADHAVAQRLLQVDSSIFPKTTAGVQAAVRLAEMFPEIAEGRGVQTMPMAGTVDETGRYRRTGPVDILPTMADPADSTFVLLADTLCTSIVSDGASATGVLLRHLPTGDTYELDADVVVVAADTFRTPQLLYASGIRPRALGRFLNEHVFVTGFTTLSEDPSEDVLSQLDEYEPHIGAWWLPSVDDRQPYHGQMMETIDRESGTHRLGIAWYVNTDIDESNRVEFSDDARDVLGMPSMSIHFAYSAADEQRIVAATASHSAVGRALGRFDSDSVTPLPVGGSMHSTGTVRMGLVDDGRSVCDPTGRVWGTSNIFVAGNGVIPTAVSCNTTLTAATLAVGTARAISEFLTTCGASTRVAGRETE